MKKILILGGAVAQVPLIKSAKEVGLYVVLCDWTTTNPGIPLADKHYQISTLDLEMVLKVAKEQINEKTNIKITSGTIGKIMDLNQKDVNHMGAVMAPAAADMIYNHLKNNKETINDYDLILTGDLGIYGKKILKEYMNQEYNIKLGDNYNDCGAMLYDMKNQKEITAGGSGPVCSALVTFSYIYNKLKNKEIKRVLLVATGALFSPTFLYQKESILSIAHAIVMEVEE